MKKKISVWILIGIFAAAAPQGAAVCAEDVEVWEDLAPEEGGNDASYAPDTEWVETVETNAQWQEPEESYDDGVWREEETYETETTVHENYNIGNEHGTIRRISERHGRVEDFDIPNAKEAEEDFFPEGKEMPSMFYLNVPQILQKPELPTGCEAVALTMALQYEGFDVDKVTLASDFLIYNNETDNMALGYVGDPFSEEGAGCFAPTIAATADALFEDQGADWQAYDVTGTTVEELCRYVACGTPVIIWTSMYMMEPEFTEEIAEYNGHVYRWYSAEHCVVISGYNMDERTLQINDPLEGIITRSMDEFSRIYEKVGKNAVVLGEIPQTEDTAEESVF